MIKINKAKITQEIDTRNIDIKEPLNDINIFITFCEFDIKSAIDELNKIKTENNRKHLQKLVYVNLINRFDYLIDKLLLWFAINNSLLRDEILKSIEKETISRKEVFEIFFMREQSYEMIVEKIKDLTRNSLLRYRHSDKLSKILGTCLNPAVKNIQKPRVSNNGKINKSAKKNKTQPNCILGYADWLYSRRNSLVHGDGKNYNNNDYKYITEHFKVQLPKDFRLKITSINSAINFYKSLLNGIIIKTLNK